MQQIINIVFVGWGSELWDVTAIGKEDIPYSMLNTDHLRYPFEYGTNIISVRRFEIQIPDIVIVVYRALYASGARGAICDLVKRGETVHALFIKDGLIESHGNLWSEMSLYGWGYGVPFVKKIRSMLPDLPIFALATGPRWQMEWKMTEAGASKVTWRDPFSQNAFIRLLRSFQVLPSDNSESNRIIALQFGYSWNMVSVWSRDPRRDPVRRFLYFIQPNREILLATEYSVTDSELFKLCDLHYKEVTLNRNDLRGYGNFSGLYGMHWSTLAIHKDDPRFSTPKELRPRILELLQITD